MQANTKPEISDTLLKQLQWEATNPEWLEGFYAFNNREHFTMTKGRDWAMGWLSCRLAGAGVLSPYVQ